MLKQKTIEYSGELFDLTKEGINYLFKYFLRKVFDVREGEITRVLLMQLNIFLLISTILMLKPAVNSLFLSKFGADNLPYAFVLVALFAAIVSSVYSRTLKKTPLNEIIIRTIVFSIGIFFLFWLLLLIDFFEGWVLYLFYIWVSIFAVLSASQFWILANIVFNTREAKRLFGFIGAGAIAGGIFGGYLTSVLAYLINSENLLLVCIFMLSLCIPITHTIWKGSVKGVQTTFQQKKKFSGFADHPLIQIRNSKHLTYLASIICVSVIVAKLVDYQFSAIASEAITDPDSLTAFFGFWFSNMNLVSLFIQLFITRRVVGVLGVGTSLLFLPVGIFLGALAIFFAPELWAAIFLKINDGSLKQSVNKSGIELLALPIPIEIKNQTKSFIDVAVDSIASGLGGLMLLLLVIGLGLSTRFVSILIILHLIVWFYFVIQIRKEYLRLFKLKVDQAKADLHKTIPELNNESVIGGLVKVLETGSEKQKLYVLGKIKEFKNNRIFPSLVKLLNNTSAQIRREALRNLYYYKNEDISEEISKLISDPDQEVKIAAFDYLFAQAKINLNEFIKPYLTNSDYRIRCAAILSLAIETRDNPSLKNELNIETIIKDHLAEINPKEDSEKAVFIRTNCLIAIGWANILSLYDEIDTSLTGPEPAIVKQSIVAAGLTLNPQFIDKLIEFLVHDIFKEYAKSALLNYGSSITDVLIRKIKDKSIDKEKRRLIPALMAQIGVQKTVNYMLELLDDEDLIIRNEAIRALNSLKKNFPHLKFKKRYIVKKIHEEAGLYSDILAVLYSQINADPSLLKIKDRNILDKQREARKSLIELLERRLDGNLERIFRLLGLRYPPDDMINIYNGIRSSKPDIRTSAIEFLDNLLEVNLKRVIIPIIETAMLDTISEEAMLNLKLKVPDEYECIEMLLQGKDVKIKLAVLYLVSQLKDPKYKMIVRDYINSEDIKVKTFALRALESLTKE